MPAPDDARLTTGRLLLGARLRERRTRAGLQLAELAERAGMSQAYLSDLERGRKLPTLPALDALAVALRTTAATLLRGVYPWGTAEPPDQAPAAPPDGRAGRKIRHRRPPTAP
jgi:transcriptional regulator with XRE-family HTH domain